MEIKQEVFEEELVVKQEVFEEDLVVKQVVFEEELVVKQEVFEEDLVVKQVVFEEELVVKQEVFEEDLVVKQEVFEENLVVKQDVFEEDLVVKQDVFEEDLVVKEELLEEFKSEDNQCSKCIEELPHSKTPRTETRKLFDDEKISVNCVVPAAEDTNIEREPIPDAETQGPQPVKRRRKGVCKRLTRRKYNKPPAPHNPEKKWRSKRDSTVEGSTELHWACKKDDYHKLKDLIDKDVTGINREDFQGYTPLHDAIINGSLSCAQLLLSQPTIDIHAGQSSIRDFNAQNQHLQADAILNYFLEEKISLVRSSAPDPVSASAASGPIPGASVYDLHFKEGPDVKEESQPLLENTELYYKDEADVKDEMKPILELEEIKGSESADMRDVDNENFISTSDDVIGDVTESVNKGDNVSELCVVNYEEDQVVSCSKIKRTVTEKRFTCNECNFKTSIKDSLKRHKRTHTGEKPYSCNQCDFKTGYSHELTHHKWTHSGEKPYGCDQCSFRTIYGSSLIKHKRVHTGEKPYACDQCSFCTTRGELLKTHKYKHTGEKPYACDQCSYSTTRGDLLKLHKYKHTGEKPYACDECSYRTPYISNVKQHKQTHSREKP